MTTTQYLMGWIAYLAGATGCILALWLITRGAPVRLRRALRLSLAALLLTPWWLSPEHDLLSPALFTMIYDGLGRGFEAMPRAGLVTVIATGAAALIAVILPVRQAPKKKQADDKPGKSARRERKEPTY